MIFILAAAVTWLCIQPHGRFRNRSYDEREIMLCGI